MFEQTNLKGSITVNRDRKPDRAARLAIDMVAAADPKQLPAVVFQKFGQVFAGKRSHMAISKTLPGPLGSATATERHPSTAS